MNLVHFEYYKNDERKRYKMNRVFFNAEGTTLPPWTNTAGDFIESVLENLGRKNWELSVLFCDNLYIKSLNAQYRNKDEPTDILSFPLGETVPGGRFLAGDIVISLDALEENTRLFKVSADEELCRLLVHGILHLCGHDHATNAAKEPMLRLQESILTQLSRPPKKNHGARRSTENVYEF
jgi:probable rRNA maturation factor